MGRRDSLWYGVRGPGACGVYNCKKQTKREIARPEKDIKDGGLCTFFLG